MNKKTIIYILIIIAAIALVLAVLANIKKTEPQANNQNNQSQIEDGLPIVDENNVPIKEFSMTSFTEFVDGKPKPQYSLKEITVKKGDIVRITITTTSGMHNFNIDEYNISAETPLNEPTFIEFKANQGGEFVYYCSKLGHRQAGHLGILKVTE